MRSGLAATKTGASVLILTLLSSSAFSADVTQERLENSDREPQNWLTVHGNYAAHNFSQLKEINRSNVKNLRVAFTVPIPSALVAVTNANLEGPVLVDEGIIYYVDSWGTTYRVDATSGTRGRIMWSTDPLIDKSGYSASNFFTRGNALWNDRVFDNLFDGRVVAMSQRTGEIVWNKQIAGHDTTSPNWQDTVTEGFTGAPLAAAGQILVGQSKGDWGTRGWVGAIDAETGNQSWRTYVIPAPGEPGFETWKDDHNAWRTGGGAVYVTGSYDPALRLTYWGVSNPVPIFDPETRPGDNLFTDSVLALDIDTGKIKWYFQYTPNDSWDFDEVGVHFLYDAPGTGGGATRKTVAHFARNGFFYNLDRTTGAFLNATQYVDGINWTKGIDQRTGKPIEYDRTKDVQTYIPETRNLRDNPSATICPSFTGGVRWQPPSYNPTTGIAYGVGLDGCAERRIQPAPPSTTAGNAVTFQGGSLANRVTSAIFAIDAKRGATVAKLPLPYDNLAGVLDTAGGLLFTGHVDGSLIAYRDDTLEELWSFNTGIQIKAPPVSYRVNGRQYIAVLAGGGGSPAGYAELATQKQGAMLYVFSL
ncbi:MAG: PQQ-binding-like beta-propeller repeat protein [Bauldia sp.]